MSTGLLIVGHGSRDTKANLEFEALVSTYRSRRADLTVAHGYVELAQPSLITALRCLAQQVDVIVVLPLFLFTAGHVKNDIPLALAQIRRQYSSTQFVVARALGVHPSLVDLAYERAKPELDGVRELMKTAVIVVGRGSSDPDANAEFCKVVRLFAEGRNLGWVLPSFIGITRPTFVETAELVSRARPERIVVVPYFLFGGRLIDKISERVTAFRSRYPWIKIEQAGYLGGDERLVHLIDERLNETITGTHPLPCDTCQYRIPLSGVTDKVGGINALLWSLRHAFTHTQAMPHLHAHRPLTKHVLVCTNADCADRGSLQLLAELRRLIKEEGRNADIKVTRTLCMGRCGEGPTVAVYPDGIWYRGVTQADAQEIVDEHLLADRLVSRLVDNIMQ